MEKFFTFGAVAGVFGALAIMSQGPMLTYPMGFSAPSAFAAMIVVSMVCVGGAATLIDLQKE